MRWARFLLLFAAASLIAGATTVSFVGPDNPQTGQPCNPATDVSCILGEASAYAIYGVQLTSPTTSSDPWVLTIETNYPACIPGTPGCTLQHTIATPGSIIPPAPYGGVPGQPIFSISDFLIRWNNINYGVVLAQHINNGNTVDSYVAGNLYQAPNTQPDEITAGSLMLPLGLASRQNIDVWLAAGGALLGTGNVSVVAGGNGTPAAYTITDRFMAPAGFLSTGTFSIVASSYPCANGLIIGNGTFEGGNNGVPEPSTLLLAAPVLLFMGVRRLRKNRS